MVYELDKKYAWKKGFKYSVSASEAAQCFHELEAKNGEVTAESVLDASRSEESVLHPCFEWDDTIAAEKYRTAQASRMISNLYVIRSSKDDSGEDKELVTRAYVNVVDERKGRFVNEEKAMSDEEMRSFVLKQALKELEAFRKKYENLQELASLFAEIEKLLEVA